MTDDIFSKTGDAGTEQSQLANLVGEDKKFKTNEDLAKGKIESDAFIEQLKEEVKIARANTAELEQKGSQQDQITELLKTVREHQKQGDEGDDNQVTDEDLSKRIKDIMQGETEAATASQNRAAANKAVLDMLKGDVEAAKVYVAGKAKALGITPEGLATLSESSPSAFIKLMEVDPSTVSQGITPLPNVDTGGGDLGPAKEVEGHKTKAYYDALKAEIGPGKYWNDPKIQGQYAKDAMFLKERFNH